MKKRIFLITLGAILLLAAAFLLFTGQYYHADETAMAALQSDDVVHVTATEYGWLFDGPAEAEALIFYPGAKVEEIAYAPLLRLVAEQGLDVCLIKMPFRLALLGMNRGDRAMQNENYTSWYIGGHSLGGVMAADYAARHSAALTGIVLLASYPTKKLDDRLSAVTIYGSEDGVLDTAKMHEHDPLLPADVERYVIAGGNHAQFGSYGNQSGDGDAAISAEDQQRQTAEWIIGMKGTVS